MKIVWVTLFGRENKYIRREFKSKRCELVKAIRKLNDKEQRWLKDHKISRRVVDFALENNVSVIRLETLEYPKYGKNKPQKRKGSSYIVILSSGITH